MTMKFSVFVVLLGLSSSIFGFAQAIFCENCKTVDLRSRGGYVAHEVSDVANVIIMTVSHEYSSSTCRIDSTFGHNGPIVWVDGGCYARFNICYTRGYTRPFTCGAWWWPLDSVCKIPICDVAGIAVRDIGPQNIFCSLGNFRYRYDWFWRTITVSGLCRAQFYLGCRRC